MEYTPRSVLGKGLPEALAVDVGNLVSPAIVRRLRTTHAWTRQRKLLVIGIESLSAPVAIPCGRELVFGNETIAAREYFRRVIERGDMIDAVISPARDAVFPMTCFWVRIEFVGEPRDAGNYSKKDDGLFAMRAKAGEKAERVVARHLRDNLQHRFTAGMCDSPGFFEIRYAGKKTRRPDRKCTTCGLTFEVKKRNKDEKFRVSHSALRPFSTENALDGWHAFVFPDMKPRFVANAVIAQAIEAGRCEPGYDEYDVWVDINDDAIALSEPPRCSGPDQGG
jgi:hypothetical protein